jgi:hypothetical protein
MKCKFVPAICLSSLLSMTGNAEEGGSGHYLPGAMASFVDGVPPKETFVVRYNVAYYQGGVTLTEPLPIAGPQTVGADATSWAQGISLLWRPPLDLGSGGVTPLARPSPGRGWTYLPTSRRAALPASDPVPSTPSGTLC